MKKKINITMTPKKSCGICAMFPSCMSLLSRRGEQRAPRPGQAAVVLNVYDMYWTNWYTAGAGVGVFHSGVQVHGSEWAYGGHPYAFTGVFEITPRDERELGEQFRFRQSVHIGYTDFSEDEVRRLVAELGKQFRGDRYHLMNNNCNHFTSAFCLALCDHDIPAWVNRLAYVSSCVPFLQRCLPKRTDTAAGAEAPPPPGSSAVSSAAGSIIRHTGITSICKESEFRCSNGTCITADLVCNNLQDCPDGADEASCYTELESYEVAMKAPLRSKRQTKCRKSEFQCLDGSCIPSHQRCDGRYHCEDQSDESHALCRKTKCPPHAFTCMYGACIDGDQLCNGVDDCVDGSDELHPKCRNEPKNYGKYFTCFDGTKIFSTNLCDGKAHCPDRSDEVLQSCAGVKCPSYGFQCAYGACVDQDADCNGKVECADGSDENEQLCANQEVTGPNSISSRFDNKPRTNQRKCYVPPNPDHGKFELTASDALNNFLLTVNCDPDYTVVGNNKIFCNNGVWSQNVTRHHCVRYCTLKKHPSVFYKCLESGQWEGERDCNHIEPEGTMVRATCNFHYNSSNNRQTMICQGGEWSHNITCEPECGTIPPQIEQLSIGGRSAFRGEVSWQAAVYEIDQRSSSYELICGGSIINNDFIISAAHCFWNETAGGTKNAQSIAIAVGKHYRDWNNKSDIHEQKFDVDKIFIPELYQHISNGYARDIALLKLNTSIVYTNFVRPICLDFNIVLPLKQSQPYDIGRVAGWGYMSPEGHLPRVLRLVHLPYHLLETCADLTDKNFRSHLGTDKICAGYNNGTATLCKGDSGGGLAFPVEKEKITRYYLKGIVSNGPQPENNTLCNPRAVILFTDIYYFKPFIRNVLNKYHYIV